MKNFENTDLNITAANEQLQGFEIKGDAESLEKEYAGIFENVESKELFEEFGRVMEDMPQEEVDNLLTGNTEPVEQRAKDLWKWPAKKIKQFVIFALISVAASPVYGQGKEGVLRDLPTVTAPGVQSMFRTPGMIRIGEGVVVSPHRAEKQALEKNRQTIHNIYINGKPAHIMYSDGVKTVIGTSESVYEIHADGSEVAVGTVIVE